jgi:REP element-mobilizing transposase RayT
MVIGYHLIWTLYGWWLPNDPRGSMSRSIASDVISELGAVHYGRKKIQPSSREIRAFYDLAATKLKHPLLTLSPSDAQIIAEAFSDTIRKYCYTCYACAIMPDHIHILIRKHKHLAEAMIDHFQDASSMLLIAQNTRPPDHPVWGGSGWKVFLDCPEDVRRTVRYIDDNPPKTHLPRQRHQFITPYDNWPLHKRK